VIAHAGGPLEADSFDPRLQQLRRMSFTDACHRWNIQTVYGPPVLTVCCAWPTHWHAQVMAEEVVSHSSAKGHPEHIGIRHRLRRFR
jgi:hypothetical protein